MKIFKNIPKGISLLELTLVLTIIAVLLIMATRYYSAASESKRLADVNAELGIIQNAGNRWLLNHTDYTDLTEVTSFKDFVDRNYLPPEYYDITTKSTKLKNPWQGNITVVFATGNMSVTLDNVPKSSAEKLQYQYKSILCQTSEPNPKIDCGKDEKQQTANTACTIDFSFLLTCTQAQADSINK